MLNMQSLAEAEKEARRFLDKCIDLRGRINRDGEYAAFDGCRESAALKRASMDLTHALTELRGR